MKFKYSIEKKPGTLIKTYIAEIKGPHETYVFKRRFIKLMRKSYNGRMYCMAEIGGHGLFELSAKRIDYETGKVLNIERQWFVYYRRKIYFIDRDEVLLAKMNLDLQYKKPKNDVCCYSEALLPKAEIVQ